MYSDGRSLKMSIQSPAIMESCAPGGSCDGFTSGMVMARSWSAGEYRFFESCTKGKIVKMSFSLQQLRMRNEHSNIW